MVQLRHRASPGSGVSEAHLSRVNIKPARKGVLSKLLY